MSLDRRSIIISLAVEGHLESLKAVLGENPKQIELDIALENSIAYSFTEVAEFLLSKGANFAHNNYEGSYYAVHNNELKGLKFLISKGVDINVNNGMLLNASIFTSINEKEYEITKWLVLNGADKSLLTEKSFQLIDNYGTNELKEILK